MDKNTQYEIFSKDMHQYLLDESIRNNIKTLKLEHNIKLEGKSGQKHQIDVYWEYEYNNKTYKIIIESKNYSNSVSIAKVRDFFGVIFDLRDQEICGYMITKKGFQEGAIKFAKEYNIKLMELRTENKESDFDGLIQKVDICLMIAHIQENVSKWGINEQYLKEVLGFKTGDKFHINSPAYKVLLEFNNENKIIPINEYLKMQRENLDLKLNELITVRKDFDNTFLVDVIGNQKFKLDYIEIQYKLTESEEHINIDAMDSVKAIIKDVIFNNIEFVRK